MGVDKSKLGLVHVITGDGSGKTRSALGLALRAMGHGLRVYMVQFMKLGYTGEILHLIQLSEKMETVPFEIQPFSVKCKNDKDHQRLIRLGLFEGYCRDCFAPNPFDSEKAEEAFETAKRAAESGRFDIVVMDEINVVVSKGLLPVQKVLSLIQSKAPNCELVLTGRDAPPELVEAADYVSEVRKVKHPYDKKIYARKGIEF